jgi:hypothetical protein
MRKIEKEEREKERTERMEGERKKKVRNCGKKD